MKKILKLTLKRQPFEVMITGEKTIEYRQKSKWIDSRLFNKDGTQRKYDFVKFSNGYSKNSPYFIAKYNGFSYNPLLNTGGIQEYSNGLKVRYDTNTRFIYLGEIIEKTK